MSLASMLEVRVSPQRSHGQHWAAVAHRADLSYSVHHIGIAEAVVPAAAGPLAHTGTDSHCEGIVPGFHTVPNWGHGSVNTAGC